MQQFNTLDNILVRGTIIKGEIKMLALPNKRCGKILSILLKKFDPITTKILTKEFNVSGRTIRSDLNKLGMWLKERQIKLIKKRGVGIWIDIDTDCREQLLKKLSQLKDYKESVSPPKRKEIILKYLLYAREQYTMQDLADELFVSRSTIYKDLDEIEEWLNKYKLNLERKQNYGISVKGDEKNWRKAVADLLVKSKNNKELQLMLEDEINNNDPKDKEDNIYQQLEELFSKFDFEKVEEIIKEVEIESEFSFTDEAVKALVIHIAIAIERLNKNKDIKMSVEQLTVLKKKAEYEIASQITKKLETKYSINIPESEIGYISLHILGSKIQQHIEKKDVKEVIKNSDKKTVKIATQIIKMAGDILGYDFENDEQLLLGLILHLRTATNRLKYGLSIRNPILSRIKENYPGIFGVAWSSSIIFQKHLHLKVNEDEIGFIALHLGAAVERIIQQWKVIIVCSSGVGTSQLLASKIRKYLPQIKIIDILSTYELYNNDIEEVDFIISTIPLNDIDKEIIDVSVLLNNRDLEKIKDRINYLSQFKNNEFNNIISKNEEIKSLFSPDLIFSGLEFSSSEEVINFLGQKLINQGFVEKSFIDSALARERLSATEVGKGIAIPHAKIDEIKEGKIAVAVLKNPVKWGESEVRIVFLLAIDNKIAKRFFAYFYKMLEDDLFLNKIKNSKSKEEIFSLLLKGAA